MSFLKSAMWVSLLLSALPAVARADTETSLRALREGLIRTSLDYIGTPYVWGGTRPDQGLDCSGFVGMLYRQQHLRLPRVSNDQFMGTYYVEPDAVLPGDLVFFSMKEPSSRKVDHVGLYLGKGFFIHASFSQGVIIDSVVKPYYQERLLGIRRHPKLN